MATICLLKGKATEGLHPVSRANSDRICQINSLIDCYPEQSNKFDGATLHLTWKEEEDLAFRETATLFVLQNLIWS